MPIIEPLEPSASWNQFTATADDWDAADPALLASMTVQMHLIRAFEEQVLDLAGYRVALYHRLYEGGRFTRDGTGFLTRTHPAICVYGHTHQPKVEWQEGVLLFNPGSAGPKRFHLPRAIGILLFSNDTVEPKHIMLADRAE